MKNLFEKNLLMIAALLFASLSGTLALAEEPGNVALESLQAALVQELKSGVSIEKMTETDIDPENVRVQIWLTSHKKLEVIRQLKPGQTLGESKFSDFKVVWEVWNSPAVPDSSCVIGNIEEITSKDQLVYVGLLFSATTAFFGYTNGHFHTYDFGNGQCYLGN